MPPLAPRWPKCRWACVTVPTSPFAVQLVLDGCVSVGVDLGAERSPGRGRDRRNLLRRRHASRPEPQKAMPIPIPISIPIPVTVVVPVPKHAPARCSQDHRPAQPEPDHESFHDGLLMTFTRRPSGFATRKRRPRSQAGELGESSSHPPWKIHGQPDLPPQSGSRRPRSRSIDRQLPARSVPGTVQSAVKVATGESAEARRSGRASVNQLRKGGDATYRSRGRCREWCRCRALERLEGEREGTDVAGVESGVVGHVERPRAACGLADESGQGIGGLEGTRPRRAAGDDGLDRCRRRIIEPWSGRSCCRC